MNTYIFEKISVLIDAMNQEALGYFGVKLDKRDEYAVEYVSELLEMYKNATNLEESTFVSGCGHRKSLQQKQYQELKGYLERLKTYAHHIEVCGVERNSYSKTDHDATFMRIKRDYMGNDQLLQVITNVESIHGALLRMNRSIQAEGTFGILNGISPTKDYFEEVRRT